jgi:hypothetical protein
VRIVFLIPDLVSGVRLRAVRFAQLHRRICDSPLTHRLLVHPWLHTSITFGGTLNIMRHAALARALGADAVLATPSGRDSYGRFKVGELPFIRWSSRRASDVCVLPEFCSNLADGVRGIKVVYLQVPNQLRADFDYRSPRVHLWTDSPFMLEHSQRIFPGKHIQIVPNIVDDVLFPFRPQAEREAGLLFAFPRKGPEFIEGTRRAYAALGGTYWRFQLLDGLSVKELAREMQRPQAFLASAEVEGCALPPQECMASGIVVVGKSARGANFAMEHRRTAMIAETPEEAARSLVELEDALLRDRISREAHAFIARYFPRGEPSDFWRTTLAQLRHESLPPRPLDEQYVGGPRSAPC